MTEALRIEQHDGLRWQPVVAKADTIVVLREYAALCQLWPERPHRIVGAQSQRIHAMHDPRRNYTYPEAA